MRRRARASGSVAQLAALGALAWLLLAFAIPAPAGAARMAYVGNSGDNTITPINTVTNTAGSPFSSVGLGPVAIAITPDGTTAYAANENSDNVVPFDLTTNPPTPGTPVLVGGAAFAIAISPDGQTAYVANFDGSNEVVPIHIASNTAETAIPVGSQPDAIAITPDGRTAYAANFGDGTVTPIHLTTNPPTPGTAITVGTEPQGISITPAGTAAYVANCGSNDVTVIDTATNNPTATIPVADGPNAIAITPDGRTAYTPNCNAGTVTPITTATNTTGPEIPAGTLPYAIAITPDGNAVYVTNDANPGEVTPIDISASSPTPGASIPVGSFPEAIAIVPDQGPTAAFTAGSPTAGQATSFNGSGSSDPDGTVANYAWDFGDGSTASTGSPTTNHSYAAAGTYTSTLTVTDNEGCSTAFIFTGQTASCNGSAVARISHQLTVAKASPRLSTNASADVALGGSVHDTAMLSGGSAPSSKIAFKLYGPNNANCSGGPAFTDTVNVDSGNGDYRSAAFTPTQAGTYRWTAAYSGDSDNDAAETACNDANESVAVEPPAIENFRLDPRRFEVKQMNTPPGPRLPKVARRSKVQRGSTIKLRLNTASLVHFRVARPGSPPRHNARRHGFNRNLEAGHNSVAFTGKLYGKALRPGHYELYARPVGDSGRRFARVSAPFTIVAG